MALHRPPFRVPVIRRQRNGDMASKLPGSTVYFHDQADVFRIVVSGRLDIGAASEIERGWRTAQSILFGRLCILDLREATGVDGEADNLIRKLRQAGVNCCMSSAANCRTSGRLPLSESLRRLARRIRGKAYEAGRSIAAQQSQPSTAADCQTADEDLIGIGTT